MLGAYKLSYGLYLCLATVCTGVLSCSLCLVCWLYCHYSGIPCMLGAYKLSYGLYLCLATVCTGVLSCSLCLVCWLYCHYSGIPIMTDTNIQCVLFIVFIILCRIARILCLFQIWCICNEIHNLAILLSKCIQITSRCTVILCPYI